MNPPSRLAKLRPGDLAPEQRELYAAIVGGPRAHGPQLFALTDDEGALEGPFNAMLLSPGIGGSLQDLGREIRYASSLTDRAREIAILVVAQQWDSDFERHAHRAVGRSVGLTEAELSALACGDDPQFADPMEQLVLDTTWSLVAHADLDDATYAGAVAGLGEATLFELSTLVGYYATLALQLRLFRVPAPARHEDPGASGVDAASITA